MFSWFKLSQLTKYIFQVFNSMWFKLSQGRFCFLVIKTIIQSRCTFMFIYRFYLPGGLHCVFYSMKVLSFREVHTLVKIRSRLLKIKLYIIQHVDWYLNWIIAYRYTRPCFRNMIYIMITVCMNTYKEDICFVRFS